MLVVYLVMIQVPFLRDFYELTPLPARRHRPAPGGGRPLDARRPRCSAARASSARVEDALWAAVVRAWHRLRRPRDRSLRLTPRLRRRRRPQPARERAIPVEDPVERRRRRRLHVELDVPDAERRVGAEGIGHDVGLGQERGRGARVGPTPRPASALTVMPTVTSSECRVATRLGARRAHVGEALAEPVVGHPEPGRVPGVGVARRQAQHPRALRRDEQRDPRPGAAREDHAVVGLVVSPGERD